MTALLAFSSSLLWGGADFGAGLYARRHPALAVVGWTQALALLALGVLVLVAGPPQWNGWPWWAMAAGVVGPAALAAFYAALASGTMGVVAPVASLGVIVPVLIGVGMGETPSLWAWVGMLVAVVGVTLACGPEMTGGVSPRPVLLALVAALGFGLTLFLLERGAQTSTLMTLCAMRLVSVTVFVALALAVRTTGGVRPRDLPGLALVGCGDLGANGLFALATVRGDLSVVSVLGSLYPVVTTVLAAVVLRERLAAVQWVGVALAMVGAAVIAA